MTMIKFACQSVWASSRGLHICVYLHTHMLHRYFEDIYICSLPGENCGQRLLLCKQKNWSCHHSRLYGGREGSTASRPLSTSNALHALAPIATQVHRAVLHGGQEVAVKVQYPGIKESIDSDMQMYAPPPPSPAIPRLFNVSWPARASDVLLYAVRASGCCQC